MRRPTPSWIAAGADAVMLGTLLAVAEEAPGGGYHWGMSAPHAELPRGKRIHVGVRSSLKKIIHGPTSRSDGTENLAGVPVPLAEIATAVERVVASSGAA